MVTDIGSIGKGICDFLIVALILRRFRDMAVERLKIAFLTHPYSIVIYFSSRFSETRRV